MSEAFGGGNKCAVRLEKRSLEISVINDRYMSGGRGSNHVHIRAELSPLPVAIIPPSGLVSREITYFYLFFSALVRNIEGFTNCKKKN